MRLLLSLFSVLFMSSSFALDKVYFVHGAHFTGQSFLYTKIELAKRGVSSIANDLPGRDGSQVELQEAARSLCQNLDKEADKVTIVAHSQGGAVINQAMHSCSHKINRIIYLAAVVPLSGEKVYQAISRKDEENYLSAVELKNDTFTITKPRNFLRIFANDIPFLRRRFVLSHATNEGARIGEGIITTPQSVLDGPKKYYIVTERDLVLSPRTQYMYARHAWVNEVYSVRSGHLPMVSIPSKLADIIHRILKK